MSIFGPYSNRRFYLRDFKNAYRFRPDVNPPRQKFQGYVNFILNRDLFSFLFDAPNELSNTEFRTTISSLVRTAELPSVNFKTETKNQYNRKKIVNTGVEYQPVNMTVFDTVGNEWLTVLMRYFSYHYMNPRNRQDGASRDLNSRESNTNYITGTGGKETEDSTFGKGALHETGSKFDSNRAGYNPNITANFFERIDYVLYHGNKGVQYSIFNPVLTSFKPGTIDYSSSDVMEFNLGFEYESFTTYSLLNFSLTDEDVDRFEQIELLEENNDLFGNRKNDIVSLKERDLSALNKGRSAQPKPSFSGGSDQSFLSDQSDQPSNSTPRLTYGSRIVDFDGISRGSANPFDNILTGIIDSGIGAAIHGSSIKDAVIGTAVRGTSRIIGNAVAEAIQAGQPPTQTPPAEDE